MGKNLWVYLLIMLFCIACSTEMEKENLMLTDLFRD